MTGYMSDRTADHATDHATGGATLACGASLDDLIAQVADGAAPADPQHQRSCATCRATIAELRVLWAPVGRLAAERVSAPDHLMDDILARIHRLPRNFWYATIPTAQGDTRIAARVVGAVARLAAEEVANISLALGRGRTGADHSLSDIAGPTGERATDIGVAGTSVVVDVQVVVQMHASIPEVAAEARELIGRRIAELTGLSAVEINIRVLDVLETVDAATD